MKKLIILSALASTLLASTLLASGLANAASTTELKVTGVIRPAACTPSFTGGGTVDYGVIPPNTLSATAPTTLAAKYVPFSITCDAAAKVAIRTIDNRKTSMVAGLSTYTAAGAGDWSSFGLGTAGGKKIGNYAIGFVAAGITADGTSPDLIARNTVTGSAWLAATSYARFANDGSVQISFAQSGTLVPAAYKTISGSIGVATVIDQTSNLDMTNAITLDGSATIEVVYL